MNLKDRFTVWLWDRTGATAAMNYYEEQWLKALLQLRREAADRAWKLFEESNDGLNDPAGLAWSEAEDLVDEVEAGLTNLQETR